MAENEAGAAVRCPSRKTISAYMLATLTEAEAESVGAHLRRCSRCQAAADELESAEDTFVVSLREPVPDDHLDEPECQKALRGAEAVPWKRRAIPERSQDSSREAAADMPERLGPFRLLEQIGQGGMGRVYKAWHRTMERTVAVKVLPAKAMQSEQAVERFHREVKAAARLDHPNIVTAYDAGQAEGVHFLAMQYIDGQDLSRVVAERGALPVEEAVDYVIQAARGLEYAHSEGVVHRDIKPGNLLLDQRGTVRVLDMGLARMDQPARATDPTAPDALTQSGQVMGTYDYMAPEQAQDTHSADHRADVYSLGCTLFRLLTGRKPYHGDTPVQILLAHCQEPVPSLCEVREDVPPQLESVFRKMLAKAPADRQQSMGEVISELEACIRPVALPLREPPLPPPVVRPATESSSSTDHALEAFLRTIAPVGTAAQQGLGPDQETLTHHADAETAMPLGRSTTSSARRKKAVPWAIIGGITGLLVILALGIAQLGRVPISEKARESAEAKDRKPPIDFDAAPAADEAQSHLVLRWPEADRADAKLSIDDRPYDFSGPQVQSAPDGIKIALRPGTHTLWITRRGFEPIEERFQAIVGEDHTIRPEWREPPGLVERVEKQPQSASPTPTPTPTPKASEVAESPQPSDSEPEPMEPETPALDPEAQKRLAAEARYAAAIKPVDALIAAWDFNGASAALSKLQFEEQDLAARLVAWRDGVACLVDLKAHILAKINTADPPLKKSDLKIRGVGGDIVKADDSGITAKLSRGKIESLPWSDVGPQAIEKLIGLVSTPDNSDDRLAAGVLVLASKDPTSAEKLFEEARSLGAEVGPYLAPLAAAAFAQARRRIDEKKFPEADELLANLEAKYAGTAWFTSNRAAFEAVRAEVRAGIHETEAEKLYAEAVELFNKEQLFDVKPLLEKLKSNYAQSRPVTDAARNPSFAELEQSTASLGRFITVRQDGEGDFTSIQAAIDAAPPNSLIEIQDNGPYYEKLVVPTEKSGLTLRGRHDCWPLIRSGGPLGTVENLVLIHATGTTLERLLIVHSDIGGDGQFSLFVAASCRLRFLLWAGGASSFNGIGPNCEIENCCAVGPPVEGRVHAPVVIRNSIWVAQKLFIKGTGEARLENVVAPAMRHTPRIYMQFCAIPGQLESDSGDFVVRDSILGSVVSRGLAGTIEHCDVVSGKFVENAKPGSNCLRGSPGFVDPGNLDYRLAPTSVCHGKASDGGDIGCRYTPEMIQMCEKALELRAKGIIKF